MIVSPIFVHTWGFDTRCKIRHIKKVIKCIFIIIMLQQPRMMNPNHMPPGPNIAGPPVDRERIFAWINELTNPETREKALLELR